mgnify:CR=1 FL=1
MFVQVRPPISGVMVITTATDCDPKALLSGPPGATLAILGSPGACLALSRSWSCPNCRCSAIELNLFIGLRAQAHFG